MPHLRNRYLKDIVKKTMGYSPIIGILGHRQVGKTTLIEQLSKNYVTFDIKKNLTDAKEDPDLFVKNNSTLNTAFDECQLTPEIFPALKEFVRKNKTPGRFLLSGSVRFTSQKATRESLTGRIINFELLPLSISELNHIERPNLILKLAQTSNLNQLLPQFKIQFELRKKLDKDIPSYLKLGGLPGLCFIREQQIRHRKINDQLNTILDRDLRFVYPTTILFHQLLELCKSISSKEGQIINYSELSRHVEIGVPTLKKLLRALESIFLIRLIPCRGGQKGFVPFLEDQAESLYLNPEKDIHTQMEGLIFRSVRQELFYQLGCSFSFFTYSTRGGARVPIALDIDGSILGFLPIENLNLSKSIYATANSFLKTFSNSKIILLSRTSEIQIINDRIIHLPYCLIV